MPEVVKKLEMRAAVGAILRGEPVTKKKKSIRRRLHCRIVKHALKDNTKAAYEMRAVLNMLRSSVGRSGEVSTANWQFAEWDKEDEVETKDTHYFQMVQSITGPKTFGSVYWPSGSKRRMTHYMTQEQA